MLLSSFLGAFNSCHSDGPIDPSDRVVRILIEAGKSILQIDEITIFAASAIGVDDARLGGRAIQWRSQYPEIASIDQAGRVKAITPGFTLIYAESEGVTGSVRLEVKPISVFSILLKTPRDTVVVGDSVQLSFQAFDAIGRVLTDRQITLVSTIPGAAVVSPTGVVRTLAPGITRIEARSEGVVASINIRVLGLPAARITLVPASYTLYATETQEARVTHRFFLTILDANGRATDNYARVRWSSSDTTKAKFWNPEGDIKGLAETPSVIVTASSGSVSTSVPVKIIRAATIKSGDTHACFLDEEGELFCWGRNVNGELGIGESSLSQFRPSRVGGAARFSSFSLGASHSCGLMNGGGAYCWGFNGDGALGDGTLTSRLAPSAVATSARFDYLEAGYDHTCAVTADYSIYCWGEIEDGADPSVVPKRLPVSTQFSTLAIGSHFRCGIELSGRVSCWGQNDLGQTGTGIDSGSVAKPSPILSSLTFTQIVASALGACALSSSDELYCWGRLGIAPTAPRSTTPVPIAGTLRFKSIAMNRTGICGVTRDNVAMCSGELPGDGSNTSGSAFVRVGTPPFGQPQNYGQVSVGYLGRCVVSPRGGPRCWGLGPVNGFVEGTTRMEIHLLLPN